ncbi:LysM peptidoglycan-binding domain-containing protein, partial [Kutzneria sp. NPDC052558]|uniref:LysM peptidoglycan-binding domain-containing protein n=1 Tax=Kutzneria sp. NPDC052558 TaxID=3364121 RepID=UPI0037C92FB7
MRETGRALTALLALTAFLVGVPAGNLATGGGLDHLLPHALPDSVEQAWEALRWSYLDGSLMPWLAHTLAWCGWALGAVLVLCDLARLLHAGGTAAARHLAGRSPRTWITGLVASALLVFTATNATATPAGSPVVATADQHPQPAAPRLDPYTVPDAVRPDCPRHQVVHGDTYWSLAETHLGDGRRYVEIDALNHDRIPDSHQLQPGMVVLLPPDAANLPDTLPADVREVVVAPGETASSIAQREYGNPNAWHRLWDLNHNRPQADGRTWRTPDLLRPGWHLALDPDAVPPVPPSPPVASTPTAPPASPTGTPPTTTPAPTTTSAPAITAPASTPTTTPTPKPSIPHAVPEQTPGLTISLPNGVFIGAGVAVAVTAAMLAVRARQRRHYRIGSGRRADLQRPVAPVVRALRTAHDSALQPAPDPPAPRSRRQARPGHEVALEIAATRGLGICGPGTEAVVRALLVHLLVEPGTHVVTTDTDLARLLGTTADLRHPRLTVTSSFTSALETTSARAAGSETRTAVIATPHPGSETLLDGVLGSGPAVLLGPWPAGCTVEADADGSVRACDAPELLDTRLFTLPAHETADLLTLFTAAAEP